MSQRRIKFTKAVASGNDFIIIDNIDGALNAFNLNYSALARELCRRHMSVGADGVLVLERSDKAKFKMRVVNPDGSEADMCGNGARCVALYAASKGFGDRLMFESGAGILSASVSASTVKVKMTDPKDVKLNFDIKLAGGIAKVNFINSGVPHVIQLVDNVEESDVENAGREIRYHAQFSPRGANVNFVGAKNDKSYAIRTYERGVEAETMACGTGCVAAGVILGLLGRVKSPVKLLTKSGEKLTVYYSIDNGRITETYLEGPAVIVYEGSV